MGPPHDRPGSTTPLPSSERRQSRVRRARIPVDDCASLALSRARRLLDRVEGLIRLYELDTVAALVERADTLAQDDPRCRARVLFLRAKFDGIEARFDAALLCAQQSVELWKSLGEPASEALARAEITRILHAVGNSREALDEGLAALTSAEASGDLGARAQVMRALAHVYLSLEQFDQSIAFSESAAESARLIHDEVIEGAAIDTIACAYGTMSVQATANGDHDAARVLLEDSMANAREAMRLARQAGHRHNEATALANLCEGLVLSDRADEAGALMASWSPEALQRVPSVASHHFDTHGRICMTLGRHDEAVALFSAAFTAARTTSLAMFACEHLADACERTGDLAAALKHHRQFHALFRQVTSEAAQRSARVAAVRLETQHAHDNAVKHRTMAEDLQRSNEQLARRADDLLQLSLHDPLTGLGNRRLMETLVDEGGSGHALVMIDVDRFKSINDGWSHLVGDAVLRQIALLIRGCCREADTAVRYGGDEFAIVLRSGDASAAAMTAERVRHEVASHDWNAIADRLDVSVSVGFATRTDLAGGMAAGMLAIADRRLYDAKHAGRNRVMGGFAHNDSAFC